MRIDGFLCDEPGCKNWVSYGSSGPGSNWLYGVGFMGDYCALHAEKHAQEFEDVREAYAKFMGNRRT